MASADTPAARSRSSFSRRSPSRSCGLAALNVSPITRAPPSFRARCAAAITTGFFRGGTWWKAMAETTASYPAPRSAVETSASRRMTRSPAKASLGRAKASISAERSTAVTSARGNRSSSFLVSVPVPAPSSRTRSGSRPPSAAIASTVSCISPYVGICLVNEVSYSPASRSKCLRERLTLRCSAGISTLPTAAQCDGPPRDMAPVYGAARAESSPAWV